MKDTSWLKTAVEFVAFNFLLFFVSNFLMENPIKSFDWMLLAILITRMLLPLMYLVATLSIFYSFNKLVLKRSTPKLIKKLMIYSIASFSAFGLLLGAWIFFAPITKNGTSIYILLVETALNQLKDFFSGKTTFLSFFPLFCLTASIPLLTPTLFSWVITGIALFGFVTVQVNDFRQTRLLTNITFLLLQISIGLSSLLGMCFTVSYVIVCILLMVFLPINIASIIFAIITNSSVDWSSKAIALVFGWIAFSIFSIGTLALTSLAILAISFFFNYSNTFKPFHSFVWKICFPFLQFIQIKIIPVTIFSPASLITHYYILGGLLFFQQRSSFVIDDVITADKLADFTLLYATSVKKEVFFGQKATLLVSKLEGLQIVAKQLLLMGNIKKAEVIYAKLTTIIDFHQDDSEWDKIIKLPLLQEKINLVFKDTFDFYTRLNQSDKIEILHQKTLEYLQNNCISFVTFLYVRMIFRFRNHGCFEIGDYSSLIDQSKIPELTLYLMKYTTNLWKISNPQDLNKIVVRLTSDDQDFFEYTFRLHKSHFYQLLDKVKELFLIQEKVFSLASQKSCDFMLSSEEVTIATSETIDVDLFGIKLLFANPFVNENQTLIPIVLANSLSNSSLESVQFLIDKAIRDNRSFDLALLYCCQGKLLTNMNEIRIGLDSILDGIRLFEGIRSSVRNDRLGLGFGDRYLNFYDWAIDAAIQANEISQAFDYSEHAKSRSILDLLCQRTSSSSGKVQEKLTELQDLELSISLIDSFVYSDSSHTNWLPRRMQAYYKKSFYDSKKRQIEALSKVKRTVIQEIDEIDSVISSLIIFNPLSWNQENNNGYVTQTYNDLWTSQSIDCNEAVVMFHGICRDIYIKERKWHKIICYCIFSEQQSIQLKHYVINDLSIVSNLQENCQNSLKEIYSVSNLQNLLNVSEVLMAPMLQNLPGNIDKLVIMGNDEFQFFPWSTACVGENLISMELSWLVEKFSTRITPSLSLLLLLKKREDLRQKRKFFRFLISGISLYPKLGDYLYWVDYEINSIAKLHNVNTIKDECIDYQFADEFRSSEIIHFSGHAEYELNSSAYALDKTYLQLYQKQLSASAILDGALQSDTSKAMILSACLTSRGDLIGAGNEILGLERALFYAGLSALVTTLWSVEDFPTSLLMIKFHSIWKTHNNSLDHLSISLTLAQRWLRQSTWYDLRQIEDFDKVLQNCIEAYSVLIEHAQTKNDINATILLEKSKQRYEQYNIDKNNDKKIPFQHPYYWAAFQVKGVG